MKETLFSAMADLTTLNSSQVWHVVHATPVIGANKIVTSKQGRN